MAFDILVDRILGFIGSYYVKLEDRVDALVFAGGIGEILTTLRRRIVERCKCLGFDIDDRKNDKGIEELVQDVGKEARHQTLVCQTDEKVRRLGLRNRQKR